MLNPTEEKVTSTALKIFAIIVEELFRVIFFIYPVESTTKYQINPTNIMVISMKRFGTDEHEDDNGEDDQAADVEKGQVIMVWFGEQVNMRVNLVE